MGQKYASIDAQTGIVVFYDSIDSPVPAGVKAIAITWAQYQACLASPGYEIAGGVLVAPTAPTSSQLLVEAQAAQTAMISAACGAAIVLGFTSSALGAAHAYPSKVVDQQNLNASVTASMLPGNAANWTTLFGAPTLPEIGLGLRTRRRRFSKSEKTVCRRF